MTETTTNPFFGLIVQPRKMPDFSHSRYHKWYTTSTYISSQETKYAGHVVSGGRNFQPTQFANRQWHTSAPPTRVNTAFNATVAMDLTTPFYMLADTAGAGSVIEDTVVGPDYYNLPIRLNQDIIAMNAIQESSTATQRALMMRVLAIKHQFTFTNWSRFPLEVYYSVLPIGYDFPIIAAAADIHVDMTKLAFKKIVVPAVRDVGDRAQKSTIDLAMNLKKLWPNAYSLPPGPNMSSTTIAGSTEEAYSPWISLVPGATTSSVMLNVPPGQVNDDRWGTPDLTQNGPRCGLRMVWYAKLQQPRDIGVTTESAGDPSGGDYTGANYDVHAKCAWLVDLIRTHSHATNHTGEKAYPNQVA